MKKRSVFLFVLAMSFFPMATCLAITQDKLNAEVQVACPDGKGSIFFGSGTVISNKGVIVTNRHVVTDADGSIIRYCLIGKSVGLNQSANFSDKIVSETKYVSQNEDVDVAMLYVVNNSNLSFFNIAESSNTDLKNNDAIDVIGYPGYNDLKLTHTTGQFIDSHSPYTDYIEASTYINHGNSGGSAYNVNRLVGIPTFGITNGSGQRYFYLKIDSVKQWMQSTLGIDYANKILGYKPTGNAPAITLPNDHEPPVIKNAPRDVFWFRAFEDSGSVVKGMYVNDNNPWKDLYVSGGYRNIQVTMRKDQYQWSMDDMDRGSGLSSVLYSFSDNVIDLLDKPSQENPIVYKTDIAELTPMLTLPNKSGTYYISIRFKDRAGNVSNPYILTYVNSSNAFLDLQNISFYSDSGFQKMIGNYDFDMTSWSEYRYPQYHQYCVTNQKSIYLKWSYKNVYDKFAVAQFNDDVGEMSAAQSINSKKINVTNKNSFNVIGLDTGIHSLDWNGYSICDGASDKSCRIDGRVSTLLLTPQLSSDTPVVEGKNAVIKFVYDASSKYTLKCGKDDASIGLNQYRHPYIILRESKPLAAESTAVNISKQNTGSANSNDTDQTNDSFISEQIQKLTINNPLLINRLKGSILLQVQTLGAAWYLHPITLKRYYLKDGATAYEMLRSFGLGVSEIDYAKIEAGNMKLRTMLKGRIVLRAQAHGEAYYINPKDLSVTYLKDGEAAYQAMRNLSTGIANADIAKIPIERFIPNR